MLHIARDNIKTTQHRACFYADHHRHPRVLYPGQKVFLHVPNNSKSLQKGKCAKLAPRYCGPFTVLRHIGSSAYHLDQPDGVDVHLVFHLSHLKELLRSDDNMVIFKDLVIHEDLASKPHSPEEILDSRTKNLRSKQIRE